MDLPDGQLILTVKDVITIERIIEAEFDGPPSMTLKAMVRTLRGLNDDH